MCNFKACLLENVYNSVRHIIIIVFEKFTNKYIVETYAVKYASMFAAGDWQ